jgi:hypothetical protein
MSRVPGTLCTAGSTRCGLANALLGLVVLLKHLTVVLKVIAAMVIVSVRQDSRNAPILIGTQALKRRVVYLGRQLISMWCLARSGTHEKADDLDRVVTDNCCPWHSGLSLALRQVH